MVGPNVASGEVMAVLVWCLVADAEALVAPDLVERAVARDWRCPPHGLRAMFVIGVRFEGIALAAFAALAAMAAPDPRHAGNSTRGLQSKGISP
jgi:hypothetical protein